MTKDANSRDMNKIIVQNSIYVACQWIIFSDINPLKFVESFKFNFIWKFNSDIFNYHVSIEIIVKKPNYYIFTLQNSSP